MSADTDACVDTERARLAALVLYRVALRCGSSEAIYERRAVSRADAVEDIAHYRPGWTVVRVTERSHGRLV